MADTVMTGSTEASSCIREAVCIHTRKIFDSCRSKDCIEDLRVYPTTGSQVYIDSALSVRAKSAELLYADVNVEAITFNNGYYTIDITYYYRITGETSPGGNTITGLAIFTKRVMLCGGVGTAKTFSSDPMALAGEADGLPIASVEAVDPIALYLKLVDTAQCVCPETQQPDIPAYILARFGDTIVTTDTAKRLYVTLGQFTIVRLERDTQLLIPAYDYCIPEKDCPGGSCQDDPCTIFSQIRFPVEEFFPQACAPNDCSCSS